MLFQGYGCAYYKIKRLKGAEKASVFAMDQSKNYFIVHQKGNESLALTQIQVDSLQITTVITELNARVFYSEERKKNKYEIREKNIVNEVHIYMTDNSPELGLGETLIALKDIRRIDVIDHNTGKTVASYVLGGIGFFALIIIIALLTKSSCPYVYVNDGNGFVFEGETFGGAIMSNMERDDYMPLPSLRPVNSEFLLRITNELKERQYTDIAELLVIEHSFDEKVLLDKYSKPQLIRSEQKPAIAKTAAGTDLRKILSLSDRNVFLFNEENDIQNSILMEFERPMDADKGKLVITAKNTLWFDYIYGKFVEKFGERFDKWMEERAKAPSEERIEKMLANNIPLSIYVKIRGEWELIDYLHTVGPLADRDFVIPIDLSEIQGKKVEVKIETGFMFWEIDYLAMDFLPNKKMNVQTLRPTSAMGTGGIDWSSALSKSDKDYMAQLKVGEVTQLHFDAIKPSENQVQTMFLHTRGYYELIREFEGKPQVKELKKFQNPSYFSSFSRAEYSKILENNVFESETPVE